MSSLFSIHLAPGFPLNEDAVLRRFFPFKLRSVKAYSRLIFFGRAQNLGWERRVAKKKTTP